MSITETEIIKAMVNTKQPELASDSTLSFNFQNKVQKDKSNQLYQTILIEWSTYVREVKNLILKMIESEKTAILDTKLLGKYLVDVQTKQIKQVNSSFSDQ